MICQKMMDTNESWIVNPNCESEQGRPQCVVVAVQVGGM